MKIILLEGDKVIAQIDISKEAAISISKRIMEILKNTTLILLAIIFSPIFVMWYLCQPKCNNCKVRGFYCAETSTFPIEAKCCNCGHEQII